MLCYVKHYHGEQVDNNRIKQIWVKSISVWMLYMIFWRFCFFFRFAKLRENSQLSKIHIKSKYQGFHLKKIIYGNFCFVYTNYVLHKMANIKIKKLDTFLASKVFPSLKVIPFFKSQFRKSHLVKWEKRYCIFFL